MDAGRKHTAPTEGNPSALRFVREKREKREKREEREEREKEVDWIGTAAHREELLEMIPLTISATRAMGMA